MGEVQFVRQPVDGKDTVFAYAPGGSPAWGIDLGTGAQWWYPGGDQPVVRHAIVEAWYSLGSLAVIDPPGPGTSVVQAASLSQHDLRDPAGDLSGQLPGHALLAWIAEQLASATPPGEPPVVTEDIAHCCVGFVGEEAVGAELARLGPGWRVLHGVPVGKGGKDIDHVVVGPPGVFTINTKHHRGVSVDVRRDAVFVAGQYQHYMKSIEQDGAIATAAVSRIAADVPVRPLLVTVGAKLSIRESPTTAAVLKHDQLVGWLSSQPRRVDPEIVALVSARLSWSDAWAGLTPPPAAPEWVAQLARSVAAQQADLSDERRTTTSRRHASVPAAGRAASRRPAGRAGSAPGPRGTTKPAGMHWALRALGYVGAFLLFITVLPVAVKAFTTSIAQLGLPKARPSAAATVVPKLGAPCAAKGATHKDASDRVLACGPVSTAKPTTLVWQRQK